MGFDPERDQKEERDEGNAMSPMVGAGCRNRPGPAVAWLLCINTGEKVCGKLLKQLSRGALAT